MAIETLAVKYRPQNFEEVSEQKGIVDILQNQLKTNSVKNAYLFTGSAGTGKTTCARIFAKLINKGKGVPLELDAASNNSVEDVRKIIEQSKFRSFDGEYKIYIIDECHMLSTAAQNAMLKILEEPPQLTVFIFCTTDPQKILNTILSRVQRFDFQRISVEGIIERLEFILGKEKIKYEKEAVDYIARFVDGGMRDAISLMDKCLSYAEKLSAKEVMSVLGIVPYEIMFSLLKAFDKKSGKDGEGMKEALSIIRKMYLDGKDLKIFVKLFIQFILDIIKYQLTSNLNLTKIPKAFEKNLSGVKADRFELLDIVDSAMKLQNQIKWESNALTSLEFFVMQWTRGK